MVFEDNTGDLVVAAKVVGVTPCISSEATTAPDEEDEEAESDAVTEATISVEDFTASVEAEDDDEDDDDVDAGAEAAAAETTPAEVATAEVTAAETVAPAEGVDTTGVRGN